MEHVQLACILPIDRNQVSGRDAVESALDQKGVACSVVIVTDDVQTIGDVVRPFIDDPRVLVIEKPAARSAHEARMAGLAAVDADWVTFLDNEFCLEEDAGKIVLDTAAELDAPLVIPNPKAETTHRVSRERLARSVFTDPTEAPTLAGVFMTRELARNAAATIPAQDSPKDSDVLMLFAAIQVAPSLAVIPQELAGSCHVPAKETDATLADIADLARNAQTTLSIGRLISQENGWEGHRDDYDALAQILLGKALKPLPYHVAKPDRAEAFSLIADSWPAPELTSGVALWERDRLLPFFESVQDARVFKDNEPREILRVALLVPQGDSVDPIVLEGIRNALASLGLVPKLFATGGKRFEGIFNTHVELPAWDGSESYFERAKTLSAALLEHDVDAVVSPLASDPAQVFDLLLARLTRVRTGVIAPAMNLGDLAQADTPRMLCHAQMADAISVPKRKNATFWSMASHARIVVEEGVLEADEYMSRLVDALELPSDAPRETFRPNVNFGPLGMKVPAKKAGPDPDTLRMEQLQRQMEALQAQLEGALREADALRAQLADTTPHKDAGDA